MGEKEKASYEDFTLGMAVVDTIPVVLFAVAGGVAAARLQSPLFVLGIVLSTAAGGCKAGWKYALALKRRDIPVMQKLFRILMPAGFALMLLSVPFAFSPWAGLVHGLLQLPALACLLLGCAGLVVMITLAAKADMRNGRTNWTEELINIASQGLFLLALLLA